MRAPWHSRHLISVVAVTVTLGGGAAAYGAIAGTSTDRADAGAVSSTVRAASPAGVLGLDASAWQKKINWQAVKAKGGKFVYAKATEGTTYRSSYFSQQYNGAYAVGLARGAYHFATPNTSTGARQADYFVAHGGAARPDGHTLPGVLDIEDNPYGAKCYGLSAAKMVTWIHSFVNEYHARTGRWAIINTFTEWWTACTGNSRQFAAKDPLWINNHKRSAGSLPGGWHTYTVWQWADHGVLPGDQDVIKAAVFKQLLPRGR